MWKSTFAFGLQFGNGCRFGVFNQKSVNRLFILVVWILVNSCINDILLLNNVHLLFFQLLLLFQSLLVVLLNDLLLFFLILNFRLFYHVICQSGGLFLMQISLSFHSFVDIKFESLWKHFVYHCHLQHVCFYVVQHIFAFNWTIVVILRLDILGMFFLNYVTLFIISIQVFRFFYLLLKLANILLNTISNHHLILVDCHSVHNLLRYLWVYYAIQIHIVLLLDEGLLIKIWLIVLKLESLVNLLSFIIGLNILVFIILHHRLLNILLTNIGLLTILVVLIHFKMQFVYSFKFKNKLAIINIIWFRLVLYLCWLIHRNLIQFFLNLFFPPFEKDSIFKRKKFKLISAILT